MLVCVFIGAVIGLSWSGFALWWIIIRMEHLWRRWLWGMTPGWGNIVGNPVLVVQDRLCAYHLRYECCIRVYIYRNVAMQSCSIFCMYMCDLSRFKTLLTRHVLNSLAQQHCFLFLWESRKFESLFIFNSVHWFQLKMKLGLCLKNDILGHLLSLILICRKFSFTFDFLCLLAFVGLCI